MARGAIAYKGQLYLGGSKVEANPSAAASGGNLTKLGVDDTVYAIPQANNGKLTIKQNGTTKGEFTANQSTDSEVNIEVPDVEETDTPDTTPFLYRQTPHNADGVFLDELVGGSVAWNQLVQNPAATTTVSDVTFTNNGNGSYTISGTASADGTFNIGTVNRIEGHKYLMNGCPGGGALTKYYYGIGGALVDTGNGGIYSSPNSNQGYIRFDFKQGQSFSNVKFVPIITDITQMFGTTIADYIYSLEQATAGSGIAWLKSHGFFTKDYYPYNTGELISVKTSGKKYVGKNLVEEILDGCNINSNGVIISEQSEFSMCIANVIKGMTYIITTDDPNGFVGDFFYEKPVVDSVSYDSTRIVVNNRIFTAPISGYVAFRTRNGYATPQCEIGSQATDYEPYTEHTYDISNIDLRGIPKLVNNELVYDGDIYESNGDVTRKYGIVDLGSQTWGYTNNRFYYNPTNAKVYTTQEMANLLCSKYPTNVYANQADNSISSYAGYIYVRADSYSGDITAFKQAMSGVYAVYELATPTTETTDQFTNPQISDKDGTEEFIDTRNVPVPVCHNSRYADLPAMMDGDYLSYMARNFASEEYVDRRMDALGDLAYIDEDGDNSTKFLRGDGTWQNTPAGVTTLAALTDTNVSSPSNGQVLKYNGSKWVNSADYSLPKASASTLGGVKVGTNLSIDTDGVLSATGGGANALNELTDVSAASPSNKQVLAYDSSQSKWVAVDADVVAIPRSYWSSTTRELDFMITVPAYNTQRILKFSLMHAAGLAASEYMFALDRGDVYSSKMAGDTCGISSSYSSSTYTYTITITMPSVSGSPNFIFAMTMYNGSDKTW